MTTLKIKGKEYKLKFGYKSFKNSGILKEVVNMRRTIAELKKKNEDLGDESMEDVEALEPVLDLNSKLVLAALQRNHEEFRTDYKSEAEIQRAIDKVDDLMEDYMDEEDSLSIIDLFGLLTEELFNNGFLSKKSGKLEESLAEQDATIVPIDHKMQEN